MFAIPAPAESTHPRPPAAQPPRHRQHQKRQQQDFRVHDWPPLSIHGVRNFAIA
jgi:hypothetical protein